jgi:hypothetical protein
VPTAALAEYFDQNNRAHRQPTTAGCPINHTLVDYQPQYGCKANTEISPLSHWSLRVRSEGVWLALNSMRKWRSHTI